MTTEENRLRRYESSIIRSAYSALPSLAIRLSLTRSADDIAGQHTPVRRVGERFLRICELGHTSMSLDRGYDGDAFSYAPLIRLLPDAVLSCRRTQNEHEQRCDI